MPRFLVERQVTHKQTLEIDADTLEQAIQDSELTTVFEDWNVTGVMHGAYKAELIHDEPFVSKSFPITAVPGETESECIKRTGMGLAGVAEAIARGGADWVQTSRSSMQLVYKDPYFAGVSE